MIPAFGSDDRLMGDPASLGACRHANRRMSSTCKWRAVSALFFCEPKAAACPLARRMHSVRALFF